MIRNTSIRKTSIRKSSIRKKETNILKVAVIIALAMISLTGCGKEEKIDYSIEGISEEEQAQSVGKKAVSQFADEASWSDSWTIEGSERTPTIEILVDAEITVPDTEEMCVVEVTVPEFDEEFKERLIQVLYEGGDVYYNDIEHLPKKELEEIYADYKERYENAGTEAEREIIKVSLEKYEKLLENAGDTYTLADSYEPGGYIGERNGMTYELWVSKSYGEPGWDIDAQWISFYALNAEEYCPDEYEDYNHYMAHPYMACDRYTKVGENACDISREDAEEQARDLLEELGLEYPVLAYTKPLIWGDETLNSSNIYDWPANGYVFTFEYGLQDVSFPGFGVNYYFYHDSEIVEGEEEPYSMNASAMVYVTDKGVINLHVYSPVETVSISESVDLLPLDTVKDIVKNESPKAFEARGSAFSGITYTHMELIYFRVRDKENLGQYSYVPAWRLSKQEGEAVQNNWNILHPVIINAIDGSFIHIADEYY